MIGFHASRGMRENARRGYCNGSHPPFGYRVVKKTDERGNLKGTLAVDEEEAKVVRRIFEMHVVDGLGGVEIAKILNDSGGSPRYHYYACAKSMKEGVKACSGHRVRVEEIERFVLNLLLDWAFSVKNIQDLIKGIRRGLAEREKPMRQLKTQLEAVNGKLKKYFEAFEDGNYEKELFADRIASLKAEKQALQLEIERRAAPVDLPAHLSSESTIQKVQQGLKDLFLTGTPGLKKRYVNVLVKEIVINGEEITITGHTAGAMAVLETGDKKISTPDFSGVLNASHKWRTWRDSNPQPLGP